MPTYADPNDGLHFELTPLSIGYTYDPPEGADWWRCPLCARDTADRLGEAFKGDYNALRGHLGREHNVLITAQKLHVVIGAAYAPDGGTVRYAPPPARRHPLTGGPDV